QVQPLEEGIESGVGADHDRLRRAVRMTPCSRITFYAGWVTFTLTSLRFPRVSFSTSPPVLYHLSGFSPTGRRSLTSRRSDPTALRSFTSLRFLSNTSQILYQPQVRSDRPQVFYQPPVSLQHVADPLPAAGPIRPPSGLLPASGFPPTR